MKELIGIMDIKYFSKSNSGKKYGIFYHLYSQAPMIDVTNIHFRAFTRMMTKYSFLYTEMVHYNTIMNTKDLDFHLGFYENQHPISL